MYFLNSLILPTVSALPNAGTAGRLVILSTDNHVYADNGTKWVDLSMFPSSGLTYAIASGLALI